MNNSPWWTNLIAVAVGGAIGFASAYFIAIHLYKKQVSREENLQVVKKLYVPLYRELIMFRDYLSKSKYWYHFFIDRKFWTPQVGITFGVWEEMTHDFRSIMMPKKARVRLENFIGLLTEYNKTMDAIQSFSTDHIDRYVAEKTGGQPTHIKLAEDFHYPYLAKAVVEGDVEQPIGLYKRVVTLSESEMRPGIESVIAEFAETDLAGDIARLAKKIPVDAEKLQDYFGDEIRVLTGLKDED